MNKFVSLICLLLAFGGPLTAQTSLPSSYDFNNFVSNANLPNGWNSNITGTFTYSTGNSGTAAKLDAQGEWLSIYTANAIGNVSFYLKGWVSGGATSWSGTFKVQESADGQNWTDLSSYTSLPINNYSIYNLTPASASRYIRFYFHTKVSGNNVGLDDVSLTLGQITAQEIDVEYLQQSILSGASAPMNGSSVGVAENWDFVVHNLSIATDLVINNVAISGAASADYVVLTPVSYTIAPQDSATITLQFTPSQSGSRPALMTVSNDDADEGSYVIYLQGIGGNLATEPTSQAAQLTFPLVKSYRMKGNINPGFVASEGYLVLRKKGAAITDSPVDGISYTSGDAVGSSKVIYSGPATDFWIHNVEAGSDYYFAVFAYNGNTTFRNYLVQNPLMVNQTSMASMMPSGEYNGISTASTDFLTSLSAHINPHSSVFYSNYDEIMVRWFAARDTSNGQKVLTCAYSGENLLYTEPFTWAVFSREHTYCHQWMPTNPADGSGNAPNNQERPEYNDLHHLFPANQNECNAVRSNFPLGEVVTVQGTYLGCKYGQDVNGNYVFEPRNEHKGDAARAIFYMATCYNGKNDAYGVAQNWKLKNPISATIAYGQDQNVLKKWHFQDPPSAWEIARNDFIDSVQGNRNPFVDSVNYACYIDFANMVKLNNVSLPCNSASLKEMEEIRFDFIIAPNPAHQTIGVKMESRVEGKMEMEVIDVLGRVVARQSIMVRQGFNEITLPVQVEKGMYLLRIKDNFRTQTKAVKLD